DRALTPPIAFDNCRFKGLSPQAVPSSAPLPLPLLITLPSRMAAAIAGYRYALAHNRLLVRHLQANRKGARDERFGSSDKALSTEVGSGKACAYLSIGAPG